MPGARREGDLGRRSRKAISEGGHRAEDPQRPQGPERHHERAANTLDEPGTG